MAKKEAGTAVLKQRLGATTASAADSAKDGGTAGATATQPATSKKTNRRRSALVGVPLAGVAALLAATLLGCAALLVFLPAASPAPATSAPPHEGRAVAAGDFGASTRTSSELTVAFALLGRDVAAQLPYALRNVERLAAAFKKSHVLLVENDSEDTTLVAFGRWAAKVRGRDGFGTVKVHSLRPTRAPKKQWPVLAAARNKYLDILTGPEFSDVDFILAVDADMCFPWDVEAMRAIINNLLPSFGREWHAMYANGVCGWWADSPQGGRVAVAPWTPGASAPQYCDLFAFKDVGGVSHFPPFSGSPPDVFLPLGGCDAQSIARLGCRVLGGEAVTPVTAGFGGWGLYWPGLFRNRSAAEPGCRHASVAPFALCEHVPLGDCIHAAGYKQLIANRMVIEWEGCEGPVRDAPCDFRSADCPYCDWTASECTLKGPGGQPHQARTAAANPLR